MLVSRNEEPIQIVNAMSLERLAEIEIPTSLSPVSSVGLGEDGRFLLMTSDGRCREVRPASEGNSAAYEICDPLSIHEVESIALDETTGKLYVVHHIDRVDVLDAATLSAVERIRPSLASWRLVDRYVMSPLRLLIPQTGELGETIESMVSGKSAVTIDDGTETGQIVRYDVLRPVISCALFITVILSISCVFFATRDF
jgi:hypothetical protein